MSPFTNHVWLMTKLLICILAEDLVSSIYVYWNNESNLMPQLNTLRYHSERSDFQNAGNTSILFVVIWEPWQHLQVHDVSLLYKNHSSYQSVTLWLTHLTAKGKERNTNIIILKKTSSEVAVNIRLCRWESNINGS